MTDRTNDFVFVGFWKRVLAALVDLAVMWPFHRVASLVAVWSVQHRNILPSVLWWAAWQITWLWLVVRFGGTPGKLAIRVRIVDRAGEFLSWRRAIRRIVPGLLLGLNYFIMMAATASGYPESATPQSWSELGPLMGEHAGAYLLGFAVLRYFIIADIGAILFNKRKRAIHDFIAGSYVITRKSYLALRKGTNDEQSLESGEIA